MAGVLESLARGLRQAGGVVSPAAGQVIAQEGMADDAARRREELMHLQNRLQQEAQKSDPRYQAQVEALQNEKLFRQEVAGAGGDMSKIAGAAVKYGKPELAVNLYNQQEQRAAGLRQSAESLEARRLQLEQNHQLSLQRIQDGQQRQAEVARHNRAMEALNAQNASLNAEIRRQGLVMQGIGVQLQRDRLDLDRQKTADGKPLTEFQGKNVLFGSRAAVADSILTSLEEDVSLVGLATKQAVGKTPLIGGALEAAGNLALSDEQQRVEQAQRDFVNSVLRQESGAVISDAEFANAKKQYFPAPGDSKAVIEQKRRNRQTAIGGFKRLAGHGASAIESALKESGVPKKAPANLPPPPDGFTVD